MTYIEFFDKNFCENIVATLIEPPTKIVLVGDKRSTLEEHRARYLEFFGKRGMNVGIEVLPLTRNYMDQIIVALTNIVSEDDQYIFDLTGGDELFHVAVGVICGRFPEKNIQMQKLNLRTGVLARYAPDGKRTTRNIKDAANIKVEELIELSGGDLLNEEANLPRWDLTPEFLADIDVMWQICKSDARRWNEQIGILASADAVFKESGRRESAPETIEVNTDDLAERVSHGWIDRNFLDRLREKGLLTYTYNMKNRHFGVSFKNAQVRHALTKSGLILELKIYSIARTVHERSNRGEGALVYHDAVTGAMLAWAEDGEAVSPENQTCQTVNEIDVIMMKGAIPVFVSCKNGIVDKAELYKLKSVATRFGGDYAKVVLVATNCEDPSIGQRAKDMDIQFVNDLGNMSNEDLQSTVKNFLT